VPSRVVNTLAQPAPTTVCQDSSARGWDPGRQPR
jgi:hypothetical protein